MGYCKMTLTLDSDLDFIYHMKDRSYMPITIGIGITVKKNSFRVFSSVSSMVWGRKHGNHYSLIYLHNLYNSAQVYLMKFKYMVHE